MMSSITSYRLYSSLYSLCTLYSLCPLCPLCPLWLISAPSLRNSARTQRPRRLIPRHLTVLKASSAPLDIAPFDGYHERQKRPRCAGHIAAMRETSTLG